MGRFSNLKIPFVILTVIAISVPLTLFLVKQNQDIRQRASSEKNYADVVAQVGNEYISKSELNKEKNLFAKLENKQVTESAVAKKALDFAIEQKLLRKEAQKKGVLTKAENTADQRFNGMFNQYGSLSSLEKNVGTDSQTYKNYLTTLAIEENLEPLEIQWKVIDYLSIRYSYDDNATPEEKQYAEIVDQKIQEYYNKIKNGMDIREAIKQRCLDPEINYLPYSPSNNVYTKGFNGTTCREQAVNLKVSKDTNPVWGDAWLKQIFEQTKKGQVSGIIDFKDKNIGMYFIVKVIDEGGKYFSKQDLINNLKKTSNIQVFQQ